MYNTRSRAAVKRNSSTLGRTTSKKRPRFVDYTATLPEEVLIKIFSYIDKEELYKAVRLVCKRWLNAGLAPELWTKIALDNSTPTDTVCKWLESSPLLREISLCGRHDTNTVIRKLSSCCPKLKSITIKNCWGSLTSGVIHGRPLCRLVKKCAHLTRFDFTQSRIRSVKFFQLLGKKRGFKTNASCSFVGPINRRQIDALMRALLTNDESILSLSYGNDNRLTVSHCARVGVALQYFWDSVADQENDVAVHAAGIRADF